MAKAQTHPFLLRLWLLWVASAVPAAATSQTLLVYHVDVEQGDSTLFITPSGRTLLVDSGKNGHGSRIQAVMKAAGVTQIDAFVATHYHEDHYGRIDDLVLKLKVPVLESYDRGDKSFLPASKRKEPTFKSYQTAVGEDAIHLTRGMTISIDPDVVTCISSGGVVIGETPSVAGHEENDMNVSLLITFRGFRYSRRHDCAGTCVWNWMEPDDTTSPDEEHAEDGRPDQARDYRCLNRQLPRILPMSVQHRPGR
jgi:beta-lactamase superfamily II metal-dependent hydrolase